MRARQACVSSTGETFFDRIRSDACLSVRAESSSGLSGAALPGRAIAVPSNVKTHSRREEFSIFCLLASVCPALAMLRAFASIVKPGLVCLRAGVVKLVDNNVTTLHDPFHAVENDVYIGQGITLYC